MVNILEHVLPPNPLKGIRKTVHELTLNNKYKLIIFELNI